MAEFHRRQLRILLDRLGEPARRLLFVAGPRQTGKTTLILQALGRTERRHLYLAVDQPDAELGSDVTIGMTHATGADAIPMSVERNGEWLAQVWERARRETDRSERGCVLALDEIQKIPSWSEVVKGLWDADRREGRPLHVIVAGSAPLMMRRGLTESLAGRFETIRLPHWSFAEMSEAFGFDLPSYVYFGGYPGAAEFIGDEERWVDYVETALVEPNIERDILALERVDKPALLKHLFDLGAEFSGQILPYQKMLGQLQDAGNTTTLARYLDLLGAAGLLTGLPMYEGRRRHLRRKSPKLNVLNTALMAAKSGYSFEEARADRTFWGRLTESAVGAHLWNTATSQMRVHYWRQGDVEVDFVLERGPRIVAFEVKSSQRRASRRGLEAFATKFGPERTEVVGGDGMPIDEFLSVPASHWFESST